MLLPFIHLPFSTCCFSSSSLRIYVKYIAHISIIYIRLNAVCTILVDIFFLLFFCSSSSLKMKVKKYSSGLFYCYLCSCYAFYLFFSLFHFVQFVRPTLTPLSHTMYAMDKRLNVLPFKLNCKKQPSKHLILAWM